MIELDEARDFLHEFQATPPSSTRRRCRLALKLMDVIGEYRDRLINGAEILLSVDKTGEYDDQFWAIHGQWTSMLDLYKQCNAEIDALGYTKNELQIAAATVIFDAVVEKAP